jgi:hypothetical protein
MMETQVVFSARISRVKGFGGMTAGVFATRGLAPAELAAGLVEGAGSGAAAGAAFKEADDAGAADSASVLDAEGVVAGEIVLAGSFPGDKVSASAGGVLPSLREVTEAGCWVAGAAGSGAEAGE